MARPKTDSKSDSKSAISAAAATLFAAKGFDGVGVDDIAKAAGLNKAMIYYHFADKLALYRSVVADLMRSTGAAVTAIAEQPKPPVEKLDGFVEAFVRIAVERPWFPTLLLREISEGAPHLDLDTLQNLRAVIGAFARILAEGQAAGAFRKVHPVLAYTSVVGPLLFNAARERVAATHEGSDLPMLIRVPQAELLAHMQQSARRMLEQP